MKGLPGAPVHDFAVGKTRYCPMLVNFSGLEFIFRFLPVFLILYYLVPETLQDLVLFVGSLVF